MNAKNLQHLHDRRKLLLHVKDTHRYKEVKEYLSIIVTARGKITNYH